MKKTPDREKVIKGLECLITNEVPCDGCPYNEGENSSCLRNIANDALELLKEQKPVEPEGENCGECGYTLHRINYDGPDKELRHEWFRFCPSCGKAVKWE